MIRAALGACTLGQDFASSNSSNWIALSGGAGAGKSTLADFLRQELSAEGYRAIRLDVAVPLYRTQRYIYRTSGRTIPSKSFQDTKLLTFLGKHIRQINPDALLEDFKRRLTKAHQKYALPGARPLAVICADARTPDIRALRELGFKLAFVFATAEQMAMRIQQRGDAHPNQTDPLLEINRSDHVWEFTVDNSGTPEALKHQAQQLVRSLSQRGYAT